MNDKNETKWSVLAGFHDKQREALRAVKQFKYVLYGGAVGGGKSRWLRWMAVYLLMWWFARGHKRVVVGLFCEDYPALKDRQLSKISVEFPAWLGKHHADHKDYGNCYILAPEYGEGVIAFRNLDDPSKYQSAEFAAILVDELTKNLRAVFDFLRTRLRWPGIPDTKFLAGTNPGDVGHGWVRQAWNIQDPPVRGNDPEQEQFKFILAVADDNKALDKSYYASLEGLPPDLYEAFIKGNWRLFAGQAFMELTKERHGFSDNLPSNWPVIVSYDWGYDKPYAVYFSRLDQDGRFWVFHEIYGWGGKPNTGSNETVEQVVDKVNAFIHSQGLTPQIHLAGPDFFAKGSGSGMMMAKAYADVFREKGIYLTEMPTPAGSRLQGKMAFHSRLAGERPGMMIHSEACPHFWRTVPELVYDKNNKGDIDTKAEDHCLTGDTLVLTSAGWQRIDQIPEAVVTGINTDILQLITETGEKLRCTPNHRILTSAGWLEAQELKPGSEILWLYPKPSSNIVKKTIIFVASIIRKGAADYIARYGKTQTGAFLKGGSFTCITLMGTELTTICKTLCLKRQKNTSVLIPAIRQTANGKRDAETQAARVEQVIMDCQRSNAVRRLVSVTCAGKSERVYDISVEDSLHGFIVNNGFIVHNSYDCMRHLCRWREWGVPVVEEKPKKLTARERDKLRDQKLLESLEL